MVRDESGVGLHEAAPRLACSIFGIDDMIALGVTAAGALASGVPGASGAGKSDFVPRDAQVDGSQYQYGGQTKEQAAAAAAAAAYGQAQTEATNAALTYGPNSWQATEARMRAEEARRQWDGAQAGSEKAGTYADRDIARAEQQAADAAKRGGVNINRWKYDQAVGVSNQSRAGMADALEQYRLAALGKGPSAAQAQLQSGLDQAAAAANAQAASYRGGALGRNEMASRALAGSRNMNAAALAQAAALRAQEQQAGMAGYAQGAAQLGARDLQAQGMEGQMTTTQAQLDDAQRARNDAMANAAEERRTGVRNATTQVGMAKEAANQAGKMHADDLRQKTESDNAKASQANTYAAVGGMAGAAQGIGNWAAGKRL